MRGSLPIVADARRRRGRAAAVACAAALGLILAGCADSGPSFPNVGLISAAKPRVMSQSEKADAIRDMQETQATHSDDAARQIEQR